VNPRTYLPKTGMSEVGDLAVWAKEHGVDELVAPETGETRPRPGMPQPRYQWIKLGRIRRYMEKQEPANQL
jgi:hypothetical protein